MVGCLLQPSFRVDGLVLPQLNVSGFIHYLTLFEEWVEAGIGDMLGEIGGGVGGRSVLGT